MLQTTLRLTLARYSGCMSYDRRIAPRLPYQLRAWVRGSETTFSRAATLDVHGDGLQILTNTPLRRGSLVDLQLKLVGQEPLQLRGRVVWTEGHRAGLALQSHASPDMRRLRRWHHNQAASLSAIAV